MTSCIYAVPTKSGRLKCTYDEQNGEGDNTPSPDYKMCPHQKYCYKDLIWEPIGVGKCKKYKPM